MKWYTDWWCITLAPENEEEKTLLKSLLEILDDAEWRYEEGKVQWTDEVYAYPKRDPLPDTEGLMFTR